MNLEPRSNKSITYTPSVFRTSLIHLVPWNDKSVGINCVSITGRVIGACTAEKELIRCDRRKSLPVTGLFPHLIMKGCSGSVVFKYQGTYSKVRKTNTVFHRAKLILFKS